MARIASPGLQTQQAILSLPWAICSPAAVEVEAKAEGFLALFFEVYMDVEDIFEGDGAEVLAFGGEAGPANDVAVALAVGRSDLGCARRCARRLP